MKRMYLFPRVFLSLSRNLKSPAIPALIAVCLLSTSTGRAISSKQSNVGSSASPVQLEIEKLRRRMSSTDVEERREAVTRLGSLRRRASSEVAAAALSDPDEIVRATAARAVLGLPPEDAVGYLVPLLSDKKEFVRREAAYALGETRSVKAVPSLVSALQGDKEAGVRGAAAIALGRIKDQSATFPLMGALEGRSSDRKRSARSEKNEYVSRAAARSLGEIRNPSAVPALVELLNDPKASDDLRREAANALGLIGDAAAVDSLRAAQSANDPYLSRIAYEALKRLAYLGNKR
jgi:HEAT repeat protein